MAILRNCDIEKRKDTSEKVHIGEKVAGRSKLSSSAGRSPRGQWRCWLSGLSLSERLLGETRLREPRTRGKCARVDRERHTRAARAPRLRHAHCGERVVRAEFCVD